MVRSALARALAVTIVVTVAACGAPQHRADANGGRHVEPQAKPAVVLLPADQAVAQARELVKNGKLEDARAVLDKARGPRGTRGGGAAVAIELARVSLRLGERSAARGLLDETPANLQPDLAVLKALTLRD